VLAVRPERPHLFSSDGKLRFWRSGPGMMPEYSLFINSGLLDQWCFSGGNLNHFLKKRQSWIAALLGDFRDLGSKLRVSVTPSFSFLFSASRVGYRACRAFRQIAPSSHTLLLSRTYNQRNSSVFVFGKRSDPRFAASAAAARRSRVVSLLWTLG